MKHTWHQPEETLIRVHGLHPVVVNPEGARTGARWEGVDQRNREVRIAYAWGQLSFGVGQYPDGGLLGTLDDTDAAFKRECPIEKVKALIAWAGWPVEWVA